MYIQRSDIDTLFMYQTQLIGYKITIIHEQYYLFKKNQAL